MSSLQAGCLFFKMGPDLSKMLTSEKKKTETKLICQTSKSLSGGVCGCWGLGLGGSMRVYTLNLQLL